MPDQSARSAPPPTQHHPPVPLIQRQSHHPPRQRLERRPGWSSEAHDIPALLNTHPVLLAHGCWSVRSAPDATSSTGPTDPAAVASPTMSKTRAEGALMQTCRLRAARGRGAAAYPLHPRSRAPGSHRLLQTRRPGADRARLSGRARSPQRAPRARLRAGPIGGPHSRGPHGALVAGCGITVRDNVSAVRSSVCRATPGR